jgi:hypothetical protein
MRRIANHPAAGKAGVALLFAIVRHRCRATAQRSWP